jgi:hypothetical protein
MKEYKILFREGQPLLVHMDCGTSWVVVEGTDMSKMVDTLIAHTCPDPDSPKGRIIAAARQQIIDQIQEG